MNKDDVKMMIVSEKTDTQLEGDVRLVFRSLLSCGVSS